LYSHWISCERKRPKTALQPSKVLCDERNTLEIVVTERENVKLVKGLESPKLRYLVVLQAEVGKVDQGFQPLDGLDVVVGQICVRAWAVCA
jgi:hypothetical protein